MCLECGFYNGRQVMDLKAEKTKRDARIKAKEDRITADLALGAPETPAAPAENIAKEEEAQEVKKTEAKKKKAKAETTSEEKSA